MKVTSFKIHLWLSWVFIVALAGALSPRYEPFFVLIVTSLFGVFNYIALKLSWKNREQIEKIKQLSDAVAVMGMLVFLGLLFASNLVIALLWFMLFIQLALNLTFEQDRHLYYSLVVSFVLLSAGAAESKTGFYLVYIMLYCVVASICLGYFYMDRRLQHNQGHSQKMHWPIQSQLSVIFALLVLALIIYLVMPRFEAGNIGSRQSYTEQYYSDKHWEAIADGKEKEPTGVKAGNDENRMPETNQRETRAAREYDKVSAQEPAEEIERQAGEQSMHEGKPSEQMIEYRGFKENFDIRGDGENKEYVPGDTIVAYMQADHGAYLRVESFDYFDGISWSKTFDINSKRKLKYGELELQAGQQANFQQNITIEQNLGSYIPAAAIPVKLTFPATVINVDAYQMMKIPASLKQGTRYTVESKLRFVNGRLFSGAYYRPRTEDLQLPDDLDRRVEKLATELTDKDKNEFDKAIRLEQYLRENYQYTLENVYQSQNKTPVGRFLFEDKKGHCEYFASSLVVMLRTQGIHARLITGFSATTKNPLTGYHEIRALDGHAWVEAWVDNIGWIVLEATPFYLAPQEPQEKTAAEKIQEYVDQLEKMQEITGQLGEFSIEQLLTSIWQALSTMFIVLLSYIKLFFVIAWKYMLALVVLFVIGYLAWRQWKPFFVKKLSYLKVQRFKPESEKQAILFYLQHIQLLLSFRGIGRMPGDSIENFSNKMQKAGLNIQYTNQLIELVNNVFYSERQNNTIEVNSLKEIYLVLYQGK